MIPAAFDYVAPASVEEAVAALASGEDPKVLAGGQSLLPVLRLRMAAPGLLVDLGRIAELRGVSLAGDRVVIGAMTTHHDVIADATVGQHVPLLVATEKTVADAQVRYRGTLGGALVHADPAGDLGAVAVARGELLAPELAAPLYVRDKVAFTTAERLARGGRA